MMTPRDNAVIDRLNRREKSRVAAKTSTAIVPATTQTLTVSPNNGPQSIARILRPQNGGYQWLMPQLAAITPQYIEMTLRGAASGYHVQQAALFRLMLDSWPELAACVQEIVLGVQRKKMVFEPYAEEDTDPTNDAIERCKVAGAALRGMRPNPAADENDLDGTISDILHAWFCGVSVLEIGWQIQQTPSLGQFMAPRATWWADPTAFAWGQDGVLGLNPNATATASAPGSSSYLTQAQLNTNVTPFPPHKFLIAIHKAQSGTPFGSAMFRALAWWWCAANFSADWLMNLAQVFGLPFRWANYDPNAPQSTVDAICNMLQNMGSAGWAAFPAGTTLDLKDTGKTGDHSPQGELLDRADRYARLLILGQTMSGSQSATKGGGKAFGSVEKDVKQDRIEAAGKFACAVLNGQLIPSILTLTYGDGALLPECRLLEKKEGSLE